MCQLAADLNATGTPPPPPKFRGNQHNTFKPYAGTGAASTGKTRSADVRTGWIGSKHCSGAVNALIHMRLCSWRRPSCVRTYALSRCDQVQASAWSRWRFGDKQAKPEEVQSSGAEIFIMLPLGIIAVGELSEGEEVSFIHQCAAMDAQRHIAALRSARQCIACLRA